MTFGHNLERIKIMNAKNKILLLFLMLAFVTPGWTQNIKLNFQANGGLAYPLAENIKPGFESGFGFSLPVDKKLSLVLDISHWKSQVREEKGKLLDGTLAVTPFYVSLYYYLGVRRKIVPYLFVGGGIVFHSFKIKDYVTIPEVSISQKVKDGLGLNGGGGALFKISTRFALYTEIDFMYRKGKGTTVVNDMNLGVIEEEEFSLDLNSITIQAGIKYYF